MGYYGLNHFIEKCDGDIAHEAVSKFLRHDPKRKWRADEKIGYKVRRKMTISKPSLIMDLKAQEKKLEKMYTKAETEEDMERIRNYCEKNLKMIQRKINGKEIKHKDILKKYEQLYKSYLKKI